MSRLAALGGGGAARPGRLCRAGRCARAGASGRACAAGTPAGLVDRAARAAAGDRGLPGRVRPARGRGDQGMADPRGPRGRARAGAGRRAAGLRGRDRGRRRAADREGVEPSRSCRASASRCSRRVPSRRRPAARASRCRSHAMRPAARWDGYPTTSAVTPGRQDPRRRTRCSRGRRAPRATAEKRARLRDRSRAANFGGKPTIVRRRPNTSLVGLRTRLVPWRIIRPWLQIDHVGVN